ncbi:hypothetical protein SGRIM119S_01050 [Streptomyces griseorubiginosus]
MPLDEICRKHDGFPARALALASILPDTTDKRAAPVRPGRGERDPAVPTKPHAGRADIARGPYRPLTRAVPTSRPDRTTSRAGRIDIPLVQTAR